MYDELIERLRCDLFGNCPACVNWYTEEVKPHQWAERCVIREAASAIREMSKREMPKRVLRTPRTKRCPSCNKQVSASMNTHYNYRFCRWCGQALDWTEPPKEET